MSRLWIADRLKDLNKQKQDLGLAIGLPASRITELLNGKRKFQIHEIVQLAIFLEMEMGIVLAKLYNETDEATVQSVTETIPVIGRIKKTEGRFQEWPSDQHYMINLPRHQIYSNILKFAIEELHLNSQAKNLYICIQEKDLHKKQVIVERKLERTMAQKEEHDRNIGQVSICTPPLRVIAHYQQSAEEGVV